MSEELQEQPSGLMSFGDGGRKMSTSLDLQLPNNRVKLLNALQDCDGKLTELVNVPIKVTDYVAHEVDLTSKETGEIVTCTRLVLIDVDGSTYQCVSSTLLRSIQTVAYAFGPPPWNPPLEMTVKTRRNGERSIYWFDVKATEVK
jgi:hypothetical protein